MGEVYGLTRFVFWTIFPIHLLKKQAEKVNFEVFGLFVLFHYLFKPKNVLNVVHGEKCGVLKKIFFPQLCQLLRYDVIFDTQNVNF